MTPVARAIAFAAMSGGYGSLAWGLSHWRGRDVGLFLACTIVGTGAAALRVRLPGASAVLSPHFLVILLAVSRLSFSETVVVALTGAALQTVLAAPGIRPRDLAFEIAVTVGSSAATYGIYYALGGGPSPLLLVLAACVYFLANTIPGALLAAVEGGESFRKLWRECYFWTFPHYLAGGGAAGLLQLVNQQRGWEAVLLVLPVIYWMYHSYRFYLHRLDQEHSRVRDLTALHTRTIEALALAIEGHDATKHGHLRRVGIYVMDVGRQMGLSEPELQALYAAAMLHDIGKLAVPEHIVTKPGKLTVAEFERIKIHPIAGADILEQVQFPYPVAPIVRAHHEKWDGTGYPFGLKGAEIPVGARILATVDCLDALLSDRYHRHALSLTRAIAYIRSESGRSFDPAVVAVLMERHVELEAKVKSTPEFTPGLNWRGALAVPTETAQNAFLNRIAAARKEEQQLFQLARELGNSLSLDETLAVCALRMKSMCRCDTIVLYIRRDDRLVAAYASGERSWDLGSLELPLGQGLSGRVAENRTPVLNGDPGKEFAAVARDLRSALVVPLEGFSGVVGVVALFARVENAFSPDDLRILSAASTKAGVAVENAIKYSQAERSASTDMLTGLPNARSLFMHLDNELARAKREGGSVAVLVCDVDGFKQVNDRCGHLEGNRVLRAVADILRQQCREYDFVARMGGDEFVLVLPGNLGATLREKADRFSQSVDTTTVGGTGDTPIGLSVGEACYPDDGEDAESLLAEADRRMYEMKQKRPAGSRGERSARKQLERLSASLDSGQTSPHASGARMQ